MFKMADTWRAMRLRTELALVAGYNLRYRKDLSLGNAFMQICDGMIRLISMHLLITLK